jgi:hypothetical protein
MIAEKNQLFFFFAHKMLPSLQQNQHPKDFEIKKGALIPA